MIEKLKKYIEGRKDQITNGCGPWYVPNMFRNRFFSKQCNLHDLKYAQGGSKVDRLYADQLFKAEMQKEIKRRVAINSLSGICYYYRTFQMNFFHFSVRKFGFLYFKKSTDKKKK